MADSGCVTVILPGARTERQSSRFLYPEQQRCRELSVKSLVTALKPQISEKECELVRYGGRSSATPNEYPRSAQNERARRSSPLQFPSATAYLPITNH